MSDSFAYSSAPICKLQLVEPSHDWKGVYDMPMGSCWYAEPDAPDILNDDGYKWWFYRPAHRPVLSHHYLTQNAQRKPIVVVLPGRSLFCVDSMCFSHREYENQKAAGNPNPTGYYGGWTVTGDVDNLTVHPSIDIGGHYHGWIQNGWITQDVGGYRYDDTWKRLY